ncbi:hypothetical protein, partial [Campylobacter hyointestinalis]
MKISLFGKTKNNFVKILDENISEFWNQNIIKKAKEIDFTQNLNYKLEEDEVFFINYKDDDIDDDFINTTNYNIITE